MIDDLDQKNKPHVTDFIGDIHGHADELEILLTKLGYSPKDGSYRHPIRKIVFVGDYIDRGPKILRTLEIVKGMVDNGNAIALMGNHEYNALCFNMEKESGGYLRSHSIKNIHQHGQTLEQFHAIADGENRYRHYLAWMKTLPLFYETRDFRAVHACWDNEHIAYLRSALNNDRLTDELILESTKKGTRLYKAVDEILKGKELRMPEGLSFVDKDGHRRHDVRIKWWEDPARVSYRNLSIPTILTLPDIPVDGSLLAGLKQYTDEKPVFFGHY